MARKEPEKLKGLTPGDLVCIKWFDASIGTSLAPLDIPTKSWGIYLGVVGEKSKQVFLAVNCWYLEHIYDVDYTAIPVDWCSKIELIKKKAIPKEEAEKVLLSLVEARRTIRLSGMRRLRRAINHAEMD